jgi:hypothetical protein
LRFRRFIAVDWSGARDTGRGLPGIQVAACREGGAAPALVDNPGGGAWRRSDVISWLAAETLRDAPILVGFDFAFAFPYCEGGAYLGGVEPDLGTPAALWRLVDSVSTDEPEYYGRPFSADPRFASAFWTNGKRPAGFDDRQRLTEVHCSGQGGGNPESVFKLVGAKQVGLGSLAGMRVLARLRCQNDVSIWPFQDADTDCVCVEIFPRHFLIRAGLGHRKVRNQADLDTALAAYDSELVELDGGDLDDNRTDALISAAALRRVAAADDVWRPPSMTPCARDHEGWIFGVM